MAQTTSHLATSAFSKAREVSMARLLVSWNDFVEGSRWSKSIWYGANDLRQSAHGFDRRSRRKASVACWRATTRAISRSRFSR
jgi:hypothetical protein